MEPPVRSFSTSCSRVRVLCSAEAWSEALALAAAAETSARERSSSRGVATLSSLFGVEISGARTEIDCEDDGALFSLPLARDGRTWEGPCWLPVEGASSGVEETSREDGRGRLSDLGTVFWGGAVGALVAFLEGGSGAGHSTSWVRSKRVGGTHSSRRLLNSS